MKCLIFADDSVLAFMSEQAAARIGCESLTVSNAADARRAILDDDGADLAVVEHAPPRIDAVGWCRSLGSGEDRRRRRVIVLAPAEDLFDLQRTEDAGIDDLLVKPIQRIELELRLRVNQRILELEAQVEAGMHALQAQATHDVLTGALNQKAICEALRRECERSSRDHSPLAAIVVEVDDLGILRDWTGTEAADSVLVEVAARIRGALRPYDCLGRWEGAGFLVGLPKCGPTQALSVAHRILAAVAAEPVKGAGRMVSVTVSLGVARFDEADAGRPDRLVAAATAALVSARVAGGNRVATPPGFPTA
jgi:two-component system, cell cycle response regulator